ncbi:MAG: tetratricopeptide repeat protein [Rhizomicrobium sp.]
MPAEATTLPHTRLDRLSRFLERDPANPALLADAAHAAYDAQDFERAAALLKRYRALQALPPELANLDGMTALASGRFADAAAAFQSLRDAGADAPVLRFNLAWTKAMQDRHREALDLLDEATLDVSPRAPALKVEMLHHLGKFEDALALGQDLAQRYPGNERLMGALASLAMDAERADLALLYAERAGDDPVGRATLGMLTLGDHDASRALAMFEASIAAQPSNGRAWIGKGLSLLASGDAAAAAQAMDRGADIFKDHLGSWVASGWAYFLAGDNAKARARFEQALAVDPNFAEIHGGLAVLDVLAGDESGARRRRETALRLDRKCFGAALAQSLLLERSGRIQMAQRVRDMAMSQPIGPKGETLAQALAALSMSRRK